MNSKTTYYSKMALFYLNRKVYALLISVLLAFSAGCELQETNFIQPTPIALEATDITSANFTASWEPVLGSDIYYIDVSPDSDFASFVSGFQSLEIHSTSVIVNGLSVEETYYYRVRAKKGNTISGNSNIISVETGLLPAPVALNASDQKVFEFVANWDTVDEAASYLIEVASDSGFTNILSTYNRKEVITNSILVEDLDYRLTYYYRVLTKRLNKTSAYSNVVRVDPYITKDCKLSRILQPSGYEVAFAYNGDGQISTINYAFTGSPALERWDIHYDANNRLDSVKYYYANILTAEHKLNYSDGVLVSMETFKPLYSSSEVSEFIYNSNSQLTGFRKYDVPIGNVLIYEDYELDEDGNVTRVLNSDGQQTGEFKYDINFNPKVLIPFGIRQFITDDFSGFSHRPYHGISNPVYAKGNFIPSDPSFFEEEVFIYDINERDVAYQRRGYYGLQYEFTGCNF
ncbi:fibronectin type III domain-containing protein [Fulvivirga sp. 29W222]|uniref:Fibronectin type III domain-containing protein n=1 Tax=Fulvivirga marina TaxID=2494733 RepID=A0A937KEI2_9BACT|nr:fibronectin type III domain-containing protein [Fulvivirga marina]MBL6447155.1 fibronectin type III domain-containing protein [Fulvivirga marina]